MKKNKIETKENPKSTKREYIPPIIEVTLIEMEEGIASGSSKLIPATPDGTVGAETRWNGEEIIDTDVPY
ncbi:hypothetical protein CMU89_07340 [Elizabethkingia anophelis]|nr:hypothetical protein [Elizabethkingia anophelis]MDV3542469.1 hypothetical protein [Elizabethkingia anophelis]MDV3854104.1 hypothetical protein [Elizabethkingia anophelis]MDV3861059.1 hypothetical protein [Elizabethkingia anophelis]MDV3909482.1 hypothetical protein [Elizabethkingia anophelis]